MRALAKEFDVSPSMISKWNVPKQSLQVRNTAAKLAEAQLALAALPLPHQRVAMDLAEKLQGISANLAEAALSGSTVSARMAAIAASQAGLVDPDKPMATAENLQAIGALTKLANDASVMGLQLLSANAREKKSDAPATDQETFLREMQKMLPN